MDACHRFAAGEVRDGAGDAQDAVMTASAEAHGFSGLGEELPSRIVRRRNAVQQVAVGFSVGAHSLPFLADGLDSARGAYAGADFSRSFGRWGQDKVGGGDSLHVYVQVNAVAFGISFKSKCESPLRPVADIQCT